MTKKIIWMGDSLKNLKNFPKAVKDELGYSLFKIQHGRAPDSAKSMKRFKYSVIELRVRHNKDAFRLVYTVKIKGVIYILHSFKKSRKRAFQHLKKMLNV